jgi:thiamine pyrophosphate-dependent acetolactate synthase large subunit-like protein
MTMDRAQAVSGLIGADPSRFLIVAGLGNAVHDIAALTGDADYTFPLDGVMGASVSLGLGLALAQPTRAVLVVTGDGEVLMNLGSLATVAAQNVPNLSIVCLDNGTYGLTGGQRTFTHDDGVDLAGVARAVGIASVLTVTDPRELPAAAKAIADAAQTTFVLVKVAEPNSPSCPVERDAAVLRTRFRSALSVA